MRYINSMRMPWPQTGATQYNAQCGLPDKGRAIKELVVCNSWDLEPWDLHNGRALNCNQPSPEVLIVLGILDGKKYLFCELFKRSNNQIFIISMYVYPEIRVL